MDRDAALKHILDKKIIAVIFTRGYHLNVGIPGYGINYLWMIAALNPETDRDWTDVHFQEDFAGRTKKREMAGEKGIFHTILGSVDWLYENSR